MSRIWVFGNSVVLLEKVKKTISERNQTHQSVYFIISLIHNDQNGQTHGKGEKTSGLQGQRVGEKVK